MSQGQGAASSTKLPHDSPFKQQKLKAWQPILTPLSVICTFIGIAAVFIPIGAGILSSSAKVVHVGPIRYDKSNDTNTVLVSFTWPKSTSKTVYMYYQLTNFYQNHRRYVKSRSDIQLSESSASSKQTLGDCDPWEYFDDHTPATIDQIDVSGKNLKALKLNPCGLIAGSRFNDSFQIFEGVCTTDAECATSTNLTSTWTNKDIAWASDKSRKFKNLDNWNGTPSVDQQLDVEDEEFIVWMRTAGLPTFKKLHRKFTDGLKEGNYTLRIAQNFPVHSFDGEKAFYLTTTTWIGGKNEFLGWAYLCVGFLCICLALAFLIKSTLDPRAMGDPTAMRTK